MIAWLPLMIAIPLGVGFLLPLMEKFVRAPRAAEALAVVASLACIALSVIILVVETPEPYWAGGWSIGSAAAVGISLVCDGMTRLVLLMTNLVAFAAILYSLSYMRQYTARPYYFSLFFLMLAGMNGVILAGDMFNLFVFLEVAAIASYALVAYGVEREELEAAFKYAILGSLGSTLILFAIGITYNLTGVLNMRQMAEALRAGGMNQALLVATAFFFAGFGMKAAMVPFHAWLPDAHPSAPAPISALLSGILIKALGVYAFCRVFFTVLPIDASVAVVLMALGVTSMVVGVFLAVGQWDFKRLLAYHSISQMGYVVLALGLAAAMLARSQTASADRSWAVAVAGLALFGGLFHLFNHAMFKSLLFLCSGAVEYATGSRQLKELGGLVNRMPVTSLCCRVGALSISGVPPFNGFFSKLIIIVALIQGGYYVLAAVTVAVSFLTLLSFVKVQRYVLHGEPSARAAAAREVPLPMSLAMIVLAVVCSGSGFLVPFYRGHLFDPAGQTLASAAISNMRPIPLEETPELSPAESYPFGDSLASVVGPESGAAPASESPGEIAAKVPTRQRLPQQRTVAVPAPPIDMEDLP